MDRRTIREKEEDHKSGHIEEDHGQIEEDHKSGHIEEDHGRIEEDHKSGHIEEKTIRMVGFEKMRLA
jgi:hypothetical protein